MAEMVHLLGCRAGLERHYFICRAGADQGVKMWMFDPPHDNGH
jgi:hypothetical protein